MFFGSALSNIHEKPHSYAFTLCLGEVRSGVLNEKTHLPTTLTDLCDGGKIDSYCVTCEVRSY